MLSSEELERKEELLYKIEVLYFKKADVGLTNEEEWALQDYEREHEELLCKLK